MDPIDPRMLEHFKRCSYIDVVLEDWLVKYPYYTHWAREFKPDSILEIGVQHGFADFAMLYGHVPSFMLLIDNEHDGISLEDTAARLRAEFPTVAIDYHIADSRGRILTELPFDLVHIDADHSYESCLNDLEKYGHLAQKVLIIDDTTSPEVSRATREYLAKTHQIGEDVHHPSGAIIVRKAG